MEIPLQISSSPGESDPEGDMFTRADDLARQQETPAADSADDPDRNKKFPPTEKQMLDDDFFNAYGSDPDEHV